MANSTRVYISGCHAGPNPSPGLGIGLSLRQGFPDLELTGKDHSVNASGLHHSVFDSLWICRPWNELNLEEHWKQIRKRLDSGSWMISGLDLEVRWLAAHSHPRLLGPPREACSEASKPAIRGASGLSVSLPPWISAHENRQKLHAFCRRHNWRLWVKGSAYDSIRVENWSELQKAITRLRDTWDDEEIFLQADVVGNEVSIAYAAFEGELLDAVFMEKKQVTAEGKTWGGKIQELDLEMGRKLSSLIDRLGWTGGGEMEFVRNSAGELWMIDWNTRFPAWVHGTTLAGKNLPAQLFSKASGLRPEPLKASGTEFIRVVTEVASREGFPLAPLPPARTSPVRTSKHPSGMPLLMRALKPGTRTRKGVAGPGVSREFIDEIGKTIPSPEGETPLRLSFRETRNRRFASLQREVTRLSPDGLLNCSYSIKTNPRDVYLALARETGFYAEAISPSEVRWALESGFAPEQVYYNGPIPLWHWSDGGLTPLAGAFSDSVEAFGNLAKCGSCQMAGVRLRPPNVDSRFGVNVSDPQCYERLIEAVSQMPSHVPFGVSFHVQSSEIGVERWHSIARSILEIAAGIQDVAGKDVEVFDVGGGWHPADLEETLTRFFPDLIKEARHRLPALKKILIEPGKALVEPCEAVLCRIVEIRQSGETEPRVAVVDAAVSELPLASAYPHRVLAWRQGRIIPLEVGEDYILGRLCMELDQLVQGVEIPGWIAPGDFLIFCDAGAYDSSMAYNFGKGGATKP